MPLLEPAPIKYSLLRLEHPERDLAGIQEIRALYEGGRALLADDKMLNRVFPKHLGESDAVYRERKRRAYYINHMSTIVDHITAGLSTDPLKISANGTPDAFYADLASDVSPPGGMECSLGDLLRCQATNALLYRRAWTIVDLPTMPPDFHPASEAEQRVAGALDVYMVPLDAENIMDWRADADGRLHWLMTGKVTCERMSPYSDRDVITESYTAYTDKNWVQWSVSYKRDKGRPEENTVIQPSATGIHSFGAVPAVKLEVPVGLWAGDKLCSIAREHFNKRCALSWAEYKSLYAQLYEFLGSEVGADAMTLNEHQSDPDRAVRQRRGPGFVQERGTDDRAEFIGPDTSAFGHALESSQRVAEDMYRVLYQLALAQDTSGAMIRRAAESKKLDGTATMVVLTALGGLLRQHARSLFTMATAGRQDAPIEWQTSGYENFDPVAVQQSVEEAIGLDTVSLPSPTFQRVYKFNFAKQVLGETATDEEIKAIKAELEANITAEQYENPMKGAELGEDDEDSEDSEAGEQEE